MGAVVDDHSKKSRWPVKSVIAETVLIGMAGLAFAFAANAISKRGLDLTRDYFPGAQIPTPQLASSAKTNLISTPISGGTSNSADAVILQRLAANGLAACDGKEALRLFQDTGYGEGRIVFVDARNDEHYAAGHIPGAYQFDHYHAPNFIPTVLPVCMRAEQVVVYCSGGSTCEDSENAAITLRDIGVSREKLFVYTGGIRDWESNGRPMEVGARNSGKIGSEKK
jgi:rhodanese-related sulfurtransferase